jgi:hypothetical protein
VGAPEFVRQPRDWFVTIIADFIVRLDGLVASHASDDAAAVVVFAAG